MENCYAANSLNSVLLLKERIIKVEILIEKYSSLARKFSELEKSHHQLEENEKTAKKDAAKYLEKYCKLTKKCSALMNTIKNLEESLKDKTNQVAEHQNELTKVESALQMYKLDRKNYLTLQKDRDFLLTLAWKLFRDSPLESKENKNRKHADIFFKRFEKELADLKLENFRNPKLKKTSKSQAEELEAASFSVELPALNSVESDFIDIDVASESVKSITFEEVDDLAGRVQECNVKPSENCSVRKHENDMALLTETNNKCPGDTRGIGSLFEPFDSEECVDIKTKELCFDAGSIVNNNSSDYSISFDGVTTGNKSATCPSVLQKQFCETKEFEVEKSEEGDNFRFDQCMFSSSGGKTKVKEPETKDKDCSQPAGGEDQLSRTVTDNRYLSCKQYRRKTVAKPAPYVGVNCTGIKETPAVNIDCLEYSSEIICHDFETGLENLPYNLCGENKADMTERKRNMEVISVSGDNNVKNCRESEEKPENRKSEPQWNLPDPPDEPQTKKKVLNEDLGPERQVLNHNSISIKEKASFSVAVKTDSKDSKLGTSLEPAEPFKEIPDEEIFKILNGFKAIRSISPLRETLRKEGSKRVVKSDGKLRSQSCVMNKKLDIQVETKIAMGKAQVSNNTPPSGVPKMVDESTQTTITGEEKERDGKSPEQNAKPDKPAVPVTKGLVRKVFRKIWNGKLKNKLKDLDEIAKMWKSQPCCFMVLKTLLQCFSVHNHEKCEKEVVCSILRNNLIKTRCKNKLKAVKKRLSSWKVEDTTGTGEVPRKSHYLYGATGEMGHFLREVPVYDPKRLNNVHLPLVRYQPMKAHFDWFSGQQQFQTMGKSDCERDIFGNGFPGPIFLRDGPLNDLKEEGYNDRGLSMDNYNSKPFFESDVLDMKDIPETVECDRVLPPENSEKSECHKVSEDSSSGEESEVQKIKLVPRRSSRIQGRLKVEAASEKCVTDSPSSPVPQEDECKSSSPPSPAACVQSENLTVEPSLESSKNLETKYEQLFGETKSDEPTENRTETAPKPMPSSPKVPYNLRHKTVKINEDGNSPVSRKRRLSHGRTLTLSKRIMKDFLSDSYYSSEEESKKETLVEEPIKPQESSNVLDSIMTAMTKQTEEFKPKIPRFANVPVVGVNPAAAVPMPTPQHFNQQFCSTPRSFHGNSDEGMNFHDDWKFGKANPNESDVRDVPPRKCPEGNKMKKLVENEISKFLKVEINSVEDGEEKLKPCIAVLEKASEDVIASVIVAEVMANVDEELQDFDRPAPPLTQTQHRLMTILTILTNTCERLNKINYKILHTIWAKLFPEKFFWPDDSVEMASRFYTALCKKMNYFKGIWRFCFKAVSAMRQRWCIPIFVVFQVWPDILHNATEIQDNILVKTFVYVILHAPKSEALRRKRQEGKLLAIKHLLINFYNFQINVTIEQLTQQLFKSLLSDAPGSADALVFVTRCRQWTWIKKNIIPSLIQTLTDWCNGTVGDEIGFKTLDIVHQISSVLPVEDNATPPSAKNIISIIYQILASSRSNPNRERKAIKTLCSFGHHAGVKEILTTLSTKFPSTDPLHMEMKKSINSSDRKRKQYIKTTKNMTKLEAKVMLKKQEMKKKKKKMKKKKKKKVKVVNSERSDLEFTTA